MKKSVTMMAAVVAMMMMMMMGLFSPCRNVNAAETKVSNLCAEVTTVKDYLENRIDGEIEVPLGKSTLFTKKESGYIVGKWHGFSIKDPVIAKKDGHYVVYGTDTLSRQMEEFYEEGSTFHTGLCGKYVDLPQNVEYVGNSDYCTLGKYKDSTQYALFREGKELASFDAGEELEFPRLRFGIARGLKTKKAYMLRMTTKKIWVECVAEGGVESVSQWSDRIYSSPGLCFFKKDGKDYIVRPSSKEYMDLGQIPEGKYTTWEVKGNKEEKPGYTILENSLENYDFVRITYGGDAVIFKREYVIRIGLFEYVNYEKSPVGRDYLAITADKTSGDFDGINEFCYKDLKLAELEDTEWNLESFLAEYEKSHVDEIKAEIERLDLSGRQWGTELNEEVKSFLNRYNK